MGTPGVHGASSGAARSMPVLSHNYPTFGNSVSGSEIRLFGRISAGFWMGEPPDRFSGRAAFEALPIRIRPTSGAEATVRRVWLGTPEVHGASSGAARSMPVFRHNFHALRRGGHAVLPGADGVAVRLSVWAAGLMSRRLNLGPWWTRARTAGAAFVTGRSARWSRGRVAETWRRAVWTALLRLLLGQTGLEARSVRLEATRARGRGPPPRPPGRDAYAWLAASANKNQTVFAVFSGGGKVGPEFVDWGASRPNPIP